MRKGSLYPVFGIVAVVALGTFLQSQQLYVRENNPESVSQNVASANAPLRILIPAIGADSPVIPVGQNDEGDMASPDGPMDTAWYDLGPRPGEVGSAVIAGHRGWKTGPSVFDKLHTLNPGDKIHVLDARGKERVFVVRETASYGKDEIVPEVWNKNDMAYLNLITCSGDWDPVSGTSDKRLVVFANLVI